MNQLIAIVAVAAGIGVFVVVAMGPVVSGIRESFQKDLDEIGSTTFIVQRVTTGDYGLVLAYCTVLILLMLAVIGLMQWLVGERRLGRRSAVAPAAAPVLQA